MLLHLLKKVVEYDKYEVCPRIDFPVPQFVLPILWLNFKRVFNLSIVAVSYLIPLWQLCQPMLIFAINFNPLEILERIALSRGADTFFPFDDGRFFGNINKGFPPSRLRARLTLAYKNWQEGSLNREGWGGSGAQVRLKNLLWRFHHVPKNICFKLSSLYLYNLVMDLYGPTS